ncbi:MULTISPECIES: hypothetical protein [Actinomadura]|uniref:Uncharacterized protein n=2 Tax=Actinomadura yumaensis TaxID=111807 RepID=A0ABW2CMN2_9ACTN|nr:hypothetical protein [Actinomadura sp. J1-007]MWK34236.1 hypothetical protein [Actinomadura sp. J1-007]
MVLRVNPSKIEEFGKLIHRAEDDVQSINSYLLSNDNVHWYDHGLITKFAWSHKVVVETVGNTLFMYISSLDQSAVGLRKTATYYRKAERDAAARVDALQPVVKRPAPHFKD